MENYYIYFITNYFLGHHQIYINVYNIELYNNHTYDDSLICRFSSCCLDTKLKYDLSFLFSRMDRIDVIKENEEKKFIIYVKKNRFFPFMKNIKEINFYEEQKEILYDDYNWREEKELVSITTKNYFIYEDSIVIFVNNEDECKVLENGIELLTMFYVNNFGVKKKK